MIKKTAISAALGMALLGSVSAFAAVTATSTLTLPVSVVAPASTSFTFTAASSLQSGAVAKGVALGTFTLNGSNLTGTLALKPLGGTCDPLACTFTMTGSGSNTIIAALDTGVNTGFLTSPADGVFYSQSNGNTMTALLTMASAQTVAAGSYTATVSSYNYIP
ncbi:TPA: hypothetical protein QCG78_004621 [Enterobacter asburiae]|uniref:hypothetical protein n=1 Tax=Enterobacter asburiae TaxID=61645 RepID=UPI0010B5D93A|nr:hypothetical protein [Enterobacter asburiae]BEK81568.1 hypothetical protein EATA8330_44630 [Enterobacter asburiae]HEC5301804.1 hypothetical protein [Enterobacter asburiae]HEC5302010.1 hypothetical protein [Enterobacter asburiae]